jgi:Flp pilus assembly protein TadD
MLCRLRPGNAHFADRYAHCYSALNRWSQAREAWAQAIENHGKSVGRVNQLARCFIELQDYAAARTLLAFSREQVDVNANFFVFATIASLGAGDLSQALDSAQNVERLAVEEKVPAVNYLGGLLDRLGRHGHAENVLRLLDLLLPSLVNRTRLLRTGIGIPASSGGGKPRRAMRVK